VLKRPEKTKQIIKETLKENHIEHSTIELESKYHCNGMVCEDSSAKNEKKLMD
jgi:hypothetical protein